MKKNIIFVHLNCIIISARNFLKIKILATQFYYGYVSLSEQCGHAVGDQLQREATHGDQWGEEALGLPDCPAEPPAPAGAGAHG